MLQINEFELRIGTLKLIGEDLGINQKDNEEESEYIDRIVETLRVSVGNEEY